MRISILNKTSDHPFPVLALEGFTLKDGYELGLIEAQFIKDDLVFWKLSSETSIKLTIPLIPSTDIGLIDLVELTNKLKDGYANDPS